MSGPREYGIPAGWRQDRSPERPEVSSTNYSDRQSPVWSYQPAASGSPIREAKKSAYRRPVPGYSGAGPPPPPPVHRQAPTHYASGPRDQSSTTPDEDNYGMAAAGGGMTGLATGLADAQPRDSGVEALRDIDNLYSTRMMSPSPDPPYQPHDYSSQQFMTPPRMPQPQDSQHSFGSQAPLMADRTNPLQQTPPPSRMPRGVHVAPSAGYGYEQSMPQGRQYHNGGYDDSFDPNAIVDDGDDGFEDATRQHQQHGFGPAVGPGAGAAAGAGAGAGISRFMGSRNASGNYGPIPGGGGGNAGARGDPEKSEWLQHQAGGKKKWKWIIGIIIAIVIIGAVVGGILGGVVFKKDSSGGRSSVSSALATTDPSKFYNIDSSEVQDLLNNDALHRVFPGMDYTPLNAQYPDCISNPPDQNSVTLDVTMLSQLTPAVRLYGTDCKQTEMVLTAIDLLGYNDTMKVWLGVWLGNNQTTNTRQLDQMWDILDTYPSDHFAGVITGNEVLFREDLTITELGTQLANVRQKLASKGIKLPVATSDLGDNWKPGLAADTDIVMANVHPFFAGQTPDAAPGWTWNFWQTHDVVLTTQKTGPGGYPKNIISEVGWPSEGGNDCGSEAGCPNDSAGAVAGIDEMNEFMEGWVCPSMQNGTHYFWFEAFDEPWKVIFNTDNDQWESKWGLMDSDRNVKDGLKIPDCGGKTLDKPY